MECVASQINADFNGCEDIPVLLCVLNGSIMFTAELMKRLNFNCQVVSTKLTSYVGTSTSGNVRQAMGLTADISGRRVIVIEDIVDSGNVPIGRKGTVQDFYVTPYLQLLDFKYELNGLELTMSCRLRAPITENMPQVQEIRPFLNLNQHCGYANHIGYYWSDDYKVRIMKSWENICNKQAPNYSKDTYVRRNWLFRYWLATFLVMWKERLPCR